MLDLVSEHLFQGRRVAGILVRRDGLRDNACFLHGGAEEGLGGGLVAGGAEEDIDQIVVAVAGSVQVLPLAGDLEIRLVHVPAPANLSSTALVPGVRQPSAGLAAQRQTNLALEVA